MYLQDNPPASVRWYLVATPMLNDLPSFAPCRNRCLFNKMKRFVVVGVDTGEKNSGT